MFFYENRLFGDENSYSANCIDNFNFNTHFHRSCELMYLADGKMEISIDDKVYKAEKGDLIYTFPNQLHSLKTIDHSKLYLIIYSPELVGRFSSDYNNRVPNESIIRNVNFDCDAIFTDNIYFQKAILYRALGMLAERTTFEKASITGDFKLIHRILTFVEENFTDKCTLKEVSKILKYDYAYLSKQFVKTMNMSYTEYLNRYRINQACYLINNNSNIAVGDVFSKCGFESARSFNRNFKKYTGMTPSEFKNSDKT